MTKYLYIFIQISLLFFSQVSFSGSSAEIFQSYSGLSSEAIPRDLNSFSKEWSSLKISEGTKDIDIQLLYDLNLEATDIWRQMVECNNGNTEKARANYFSRSSSDLCESSEVSREVYERIVQLTANLLSIADSNEYIAWFNANFSLPPLHPLLSQKALEVLAANRLQLSNWYLGNLSAFSIQLESLRCEVTHLDCDEERRPFLKQYAFFSRLLSRGSKHCFNYGFWPNQSLYLFAHWDILEGKISYRLPYIDQLQGKKREGNYSFTYKGKSIHYFEYTNNNKNSVLPSFITVSPTNTGLPVEEVNIAIQNHQKSRYHITTNSGESIQTLGCWKDDNVIKNHIFKFQLHRPFEDNLVPHIKQYDKLFEYYNKRP